MGEEITDFNPETMIYVDQITFMGQPAVVACDGKCPTIPKEDIIFPKPTSNVTDFPTKYCVRECERCFISECGEDLTKYEEPIQRHYREHKTKNILAKEGDKLRKVGQTETDHDLSENILAQDFSNKLQDDLEKKRIEAKVKII